MEKWCFRMVKFNSKTKGKEKKELKKLQEEFNPSARDPYPNKEDKEEKADQSINSLEALAAAMMAEGKSYEKKKKDKEDKVGE